MIAFQFVLHTVAIEDFVKRHFCLDHTWHVTVMSTVPDCDVTTVQNHYTGSTSTPPRVARLCQIREASLVALRKFSQMYACSHVSIVRLVQSIILVSRYFQSLVATVPFARRTRLAQLSQYPSQALISICGIGHVPALSFRCHSDSHQS